MSRKQEAHTVYRWEDVTTAIANQKTILVCSDCESVIYTCDGCNEYFKPNDTIHCKDNDHYCYCCGKGV